MEDKMISKTPFGIYDIDKKLLQLAHDDINNHVPLSDYEDHGRSRKFYCGPVYQHEGVPLYVPISSKEKNKRQNEYSGTSLLIEDNGQIIGSLNFKYMVPVSSEELLTPRTELGPHGQKQANWCLNNEELIKTKAKAQYNTFKHLSEKK